MAVIGVLVVPHCQESPLPAWLSVQGLSLSILVISTLTLTIGAIGPVLGGPKLFWTFLLKFGPSKLIPLI